MNQRTLLACLVIIASAIADTQGQESARVLRNGEQATLSVFGPRPVDLTAKKLVAEFGVAVNVEDPVYLYRGDVQDVTPPRIAGAGRRTLIPKAALLEMRFDLRPDGSLRDIRQALADLVDAANAQLPFGIGWTGLVTRLRLSQHGRGMSKVVPLI